MDNTADYEAPVTAPPRGAPTFREVRVEVSAQRIDDKGARNVTLGIVATPAPGEPAAPLMDQLYAGLNSRLSTYLGKEQEG